MANLEPETMGRSRIFKRARIPNTIGTMDFETWTPSFLRDKTLSLSVTILKSSLKQISTTSPHPLTSQAASIAPAMTPVLLQTLSQSLNSGSFFDTKFILCSRRKTSDYLGATQIVYAQADVLEAVSPNLALDEMATREDKLFLGPSSTPEGRLMEIVEEYEYESDSDLDDSEDRNIGVSEPTETIPMPIEPPTNIANIIYVKDTAYKTWRALVYYCYTGQIAFLPLKSSNNVERESPSADGEDNRCSPKSMYSLAHKLGINTLEASALAAIEEHLSQSNVLDELFSKFTSKYPAIQEMEMRILMENRTQPEVTQAFPGMIQKIFQGQMPHAEKVQSDVMQKLLHLN
ncbi:hypothetical protein BJ138DRAFT_1117870 [Hygrophoropsis aurantiaca]|uniref:Uncharacterized protein n=1 Tax=Hygrophoropsis aurantiaca TaxID=72124 RepID=A0ACB7ZZI2_9AGAM|nr:hypothetical protein BJ138DRAFT_1117870 [Hygrophoropsis aurantiaca]